MNSENFKDIFISPDLTRKQAEEDRKLIRDTRYVISDEKNGLEPLCFPMSLTSSACQFST